MFCSALRTLKAHRVGPDESQGRIVNVKLEINGLSGLRAQTNEIAHRVARKMVGNESAEMIGKDFFDSRCLFTRCQSTDGHDRRPPFSWNTFGCDQAIGPGMWRYLKILRVLQ
jgi:hypothetical protein